MKDTNNKMRNLKLYYESNLRRFAHNLASIFTLVTNAKAKTSRSKIGNQTQSIDKKVTKVRRLRLRNAFSTHNIVALLKRQHKVDRKKKPPQQVYTL
jgi:hypothetical protein